MISTALSENSTKTIQKQQNFPEDPTTEKMDLEEDKTTSMGDTELSKLITELCHDEF